ncbi:uncharacterized protein JCM6883_002794 [Sporobolomyces salmoneus]|uniref:uncharacterized protein n=1 Tax=Sporobolomyces salmoneus TaxID=183962 RepID=UPI00316CDE4F
MSTRSTYPTISLRDGTNMPGTAFGIGTAWFGSECVEVLKTALKEGYTSYDLAEAYKNSGSFGKALKETSTDPKSLFITTKLGANGMKDPKKGIDAELQAIGADYCNLLLLHWPTDFGKDGFPSMEEAWEGMIEVKASGKAKSIGVSNFRVKDLQKLVNMKKELPAVNQIEFHPFVYEESEELVQFCDKHDIRIAAYGPTCPITKFSGGPFDKALSDVTDAVSSRQGSKVEPSQVLLKLASQRGALVVTTSGKDWRMREQLASGGIPSLTAEEIETLTKAATPTRRHFMKHMSDKDTEY